MNSILANLPFPLTAKSYADTSAEYNRYGLQTYGHINGI